MGKSDVEGWSIGYCRKIGNYFFKRAWSTQRSAYAIIACAYFVITIIVLRTLVLSDGTLGHNWDWGIPPSSGALARYGQTYWFTWTRSLLGDGFSVIAPFQALL